jgi:hypothetical protein
MVPMPYRAVSGASRQHQDLVERAANTNLSNLQARVIGTMRAERRR